MAAALALVPSAQSVPVDSYELMTRELSALRLRKCARRLMQIELQKRVGMTPLDTRDWISFLEMVTAEYQMQHRVGNWPAPVCEIYSRDTRKPRSAEIIEALQFFNMTGRTAIIYDSEPWLQKLPWAPDPRKGYTAVLLVF